MIPGPVGALVPVRSERRAAAGRQTHKPCVEGSGIMLMSRRIAPAKLLVPSRLSVRPLGRQLTALEFRMGISAFPSPAAQSPRDAPDQSSVAAQDWGPLRT